MIINYRGQIMSETPNVNVSYAAALINIEELRSYRAESKYNPLPALIPELWGKLYSQAAEKFPSTKNRYLERVPNYQERCRVGGVPCSGREDSTTLQESPRPDRGVWTGWRAPPKPRRPGARG